MKIRKGFISNSSSTSFIITNLTNKEKHLTDFVNETPWIIEEYIKMYNVGKNEGISQGHLLVSAEENDITFAPHESKVCYFGDEQDILIGFIYQYMLKGQDLTEFSDKRIDKYMPKDKQCSGIVSKSFLVQYFNATR